MYLEKMLRRGGDGGGDSTGGAATSVESQPVARRRPNSGDSAWAAASSAAPTLLVAKSSATGAVMLPSPEGSSLEPLERRSADNSSSADAHSNKVQMSCAGYQAQRAHLHATSHLMCGSTCVQVFQASIRNAADAAAVAAAKAGRMW
jgi:hypothetical protein